MEDDPSNEPKQAAEEMVEDDRRLPGEPEDSNYLEDASYWLKVYEELVATKAKVIEATREPLADLLEAARREIENTDLVALSAELNRLQVRARFWDTRSRQLQL